jgi:hypothetical protein
VLDSLIRTTVPKRFTDFVRWLGHTLYPGQEALYRVAYDGDEPQDLPTTPITIDGVETPSLRERARSFFGDLDVIPPACRRVIVIVAGGRAGKTFMASLRCLHLALVVQLPALAPGQVAYSIIIAPNPRQRDEAFNNVLGACRTHPHLAKMIQGKPKAEIIYLKRDDGQLVAVESLPANRGGLAARGRVLCGLIMEECAFFGTASEGHVVSDTEIFSAAMPRVCAHGQCILSSTPYLESGIIYDEFVANHPNPQVASPHLTEPGRPHRALAAHAPTLALRDVPETRMTIEIEKNRNPLKCAREYFAQFISAGIGQWFDTAAITAAIGDVTGPGTAAIGSDIALKHDHAAHVGARLGADGIIRIQMPIEEVPTPDKLADAMGADTITSDGVYEGTFREQCAVHPTLAHVQCPKKDVTFTVTKALLLEGRLRLPNDQKLLRQFRSVRAKELPGGGVSIQVERTDEDGHCDVMDAVCAVVWKLSKLKPPDNVVESEPEDAFQTEVRRFREQALAVRNRAREPRSGVRKRAFWNRG